MPRCQTDLGRYSAPTTPAPPRSVATRRGNLSPGANRASLVALVCAGLLLAIVPARVALTTQAPGTTPPIKHIVFLFSDQVTNPGNVLTDRGLRVGFAKDPSFRTEFNQEYLDLTRFGDEAYEQRLAGVLSQKFGGRQPDLLVTMATPALLFAAKWGPIVFPGVPIVHVGATRTSVAALGPGFNATGVLAQFDFRGTVQAALRLRPQTRRVVFVGGATRMDKGYLELAHADLAGLERRVSVEYLVGLPMSELLDRVARLPHDTVILYVSIFRDGTGQGFQPPDALEMMAARSSVPVFGPSETYLGHGIVGGYLFNWEDAGVRAAGLALRVLHGANPRDVPAASEDLSSWMFDARQLKRWGIRESALPPGSEVRFREPSLWREHPWGVLGIVLFILAETALIVGLVLERRQRQRAQVQQRLLSAIVESSNDAIIGIDTERRIVSWNKGAQNVFGYTAEEAIGHSADLLVPPQRLQEATSAFEGAMEARAVAPFETVRLRKDGSRVDVSINDSPIHDHKGRIIGISSTQRDITDRKRAEQALRASEEKFRQFFREVPDYCYIVSPQGEILDINSAALAALGYKWEEIVGKPLATIYAPESHARMKELFGQWQRTGLIVNEEMVVVSRNGERRVVILNVGAERDQDGNIVRSTSVQTDITERKRAEAELHQSQALIGAVFSSLYGNVAVIDPEGTIVTVNEAWTSFAREHNGDPAATGVGVNYLQTCRRAHAAGDRLAGEALAAVESVLEGSRDEVRLEYPCGSASRDRWFEMMVLPLKRPERGAVVAHLDITAHKHAELETQRLHQELSHVARVTMMGELTSSLAHELNQPLTAILSNAQAAQRLLGDGEPDLEELREILADIVADDDRAGEIIQRLRTLLRKGELEFRDLNVNELVRDVARLVRSDAIIKNVSVTLDLAPDLPRVRADRVQLQQVILNLMLNAVDALMSRPATNRKLLIRTGAGTEGTVNVAVRDSGPGIPPDKLEWVFEPFFTTKTDGMGMGLAIARSILHSHGGRLWAENAPGGGATFTLALPATR